MDHVKKVGGYLEQKLNALVEKYDFLKERRGKGLIQGLEVEGRPIGEIVNRGFGGRTHHYYCRQQRAAFCSASGRHGSRCG